MLTPFLAALRLRARVPWPESAQQGPINPSPAELEAAEPASLSAVRLSYVLSTLPPDEGLALMRAAARAAQELWVADFVLPERNLCLPACWAVRLLPGLSPLLPLGPWRASAAAATSFFRNGALFGLARRAGLHTCTELPLCGMAASLVHFRPPAAPPSSAPPVATINPHIKQALRQELRALRRALTPEKRTQAAERAQKRILALPVWQQARAVALYMALKEEVDTSQLLHQAWDSGKDVFLPRVRPDEPGCMDFVRCAGPEDLAPGAFGLLEPLPGLPGLAVDDPQFTPTLMVLPGVGFDRSGYRLGFGGGYYDRFLEHAPSSLLRLALCYQCQLLSHLPVAPWDQRVNCICTDKETLWL